MVKEVGEKSKEKKMEEEEGDEEKGLPSQKILYQNPLSLSCSITSVM